VNVDHRPAPGVAVCAAARDGLPLAPASIDYAVAMHVLQDLPYDEIALALRELRRVIVPGGVLRVGVPDLDRAIAAYLRGDAAYFYVPDTDAERVGAKLVTQIVWYGSVRTPFTYDFARESLARAGFACTWRCDFRTTRSEHPEIVSLDNRERETLFVEAA
jgi:SAM-dependent methyltransferase